MAFSWSTFLASLAASFLVGFILYVFGQRNGKNQVDRSELKERYRRLLVHFQQVRDRIASGDPLKAEDFYYQETDEPAFGGEPLVRYLTRTGRLSGLPLATQLAKAEEICVAFGELWGQEMEHVYDLAAHILEKMSRVPLIQQESRVKTPTSNRDEVITSPIGALLVEEEFEDLRRKLRHQPRLILQLEYRYEGTQDVIVGGEYVPLGLDAYISTVREDALDLHRLIRVRNDREAALESANAAVHDLARRTRDPHTFWETVGASLRDLLGR
jgi:hypothetical protein